MIEEANAQYLKELKAEKEELEKNYGENANAIKLLFNGEIESIKCTHFIIIFILIMSEISRLENAADNFDAETGIFREPIKYFDIYRERPVRLTVRALVPVKEHPKVSFFSSTFFFKSGYNIN